MGVASNPVSPPAGHRDVDAQAIVDEVLSAFRRRLATLDSPLLQDVGALRDLSEQAQSILEDVLGLLKPRDALGAHSISRADAGRLRSLEVRTSRARRGIHLIGSLQAAGELFDVALPIIVCRCAFDGLEILNVSQRLHQVIMSKIALASPSYVEFFLTKLRTSREEERHVISRELHDRVGHEMALALQHFDMHRYLSETDNARAKHELAAGIVSLDEAFRTVRHLSTELRRSVGNDGIKAAIESYFQDHVPGGILASLEITGDAKALSPPTCEELYLIMREACRNALRHGHPTEMRLTMMITGSVVTAAVSDNGCGFSVGAPATPAGGGLTSMTERVELLNGILRVESAIGEGTTVTVRVPLSGGGAL